jgi:hypothetical protein
MNWNKVIANGIIAGGAAFIAGNFMLNPDALQLGSITALIIGIMAAAKEYLIECPPENPLSENIKKALDCTLLF